MTFDEVLEKISNLQGSAGYASGGDVVTPIFSPLEVNDLLEGIAEMVENLRKEYAPTIEMTKEQKDTLESYVLDGVTFYEFYSMVYLAKYRQFEDKGLYTEFSNAAIVQAWLHQETIKVVDE